MCRNIKTLANFQPPATDDEIRASALQFVRKLSGSTNPSHANEAVFNAAVDDVTAISSVASPLTMTMVALGGVFVLAWRREWIVLGGWVAAFSGAALIDYWLKLVIHRPRPSYAAALMPQATWSFPSGHAMGSLVGYGMLAYVLCLLATCNHRTRLWIVAGAAVVIVAIGVSRLYLGVHYFSDVVGGYAAGAIWLFAGGSAGGPARR